MAMEAATRASGVSAPARLASKSSFLAPFPPVRLPRRAGGRRAVLLGVAPRSRRRDGWDADSSSSSSGSGSGRLVDEDMATLRRRIREARADEASEEDEDGMDADGGLLLPAEWTEMERRHHGSYVAGVRVAVALLEALLVGARPGLGTGVLAMLLIGLPASLFLLCAQLIQAADSVSSTLLNGR